MSDEKLTPSERKAWRTMNWRSLWRGLFFKPQPTDMEYINEFWALVDKYEAEGETP